MNPPTRYVYVEAADGTILMPTTRFGHVRKLLQSGQAKVVSRSPFKIKLLYASTTYTQDTTLTLKSGYQAVGLSVQTAQHEILAAEVALLKGQSDRLGERSMYRTNRRGRLRHREPRFDNRKRSDNWLPPSIQHKLDSHERLVEQVARFVPVTRRIVQTAAFDIQQIKNPSITGAEYQQGEQAGFWNTREYVLHRDHHQCQSTVCTAKRKTKAISPAVPLQVHHLGYWKDDHSDRPGNLITLCIKCHTSPHHQKGKLLWGWEPTERSFRPETFMSIVAKRLVTQLDATETFGARTKTNRIALGLSFSLANDSFAMTGTAEMTRALPFQVTQRRRNNRSLETWKDAKYVDTRTGEIVNAQVLNNGRRTRNKNLNTENLRPYRGEKMRSGIRSIRRRRYPLQPGDLVQANAQRYTAIGTHCKGAQVKLKNGKTNLSVATKSLTLVKSGQGFSWQLSAHKTVGAENSAPA